MDILTLLKNGERVKVTRSGKTKQGIFIQSPEEKGFRIDGDPNLYSLSGFCNKALDIKNCDGKRYVSVERGGKDIKLYLLAKTQKNRSAPEAEKTSRFDKITPHLNKAGEIIYIGDKTAELVYEDEMWQIRYDGTLYPPSQICKKIKGKSCDLLTNAFIMREGKRIKLERLIPGFKPRKTVKKISKAPSIKNQTVKTVKATRFDKIAPHLNKDGETIYIGDKTAELVFESEKWQIRYDGTLYPISQICKKIKGKQCDLLTNAFIMRDEKKIKLERLIPGFKPRKTTLKSGQKRKTHINKRLKAARHPDFGHERKHENIVSSFILKNTHTHVPIPEQEIYRLQAGLVRHLKTIGVVKTKAERFALVKSILEKQNGTCYLSNTNGAYCWNAVKEMGWPYLKMEWAHVVPRCQKNAQTIDNLGLMCNRCNNSIQSSRRLEQLPMELLTKTQVILEKGPYDKSLIEKLETVIKELPAKMRCYSE